MLCVIWWRNRTTGAEGEGSARFPFAEAERLCQQLNREFPALSHWPKTVAGG